MVQASAARAEYPEFESCLRRDFSGSSHTSDFKIGNWHSSGYRARHLALKDQRWDWLARCQFSVTGWYEKFDQQLLYQCGSTCKCLSRSVPVIHYSMLLGRWASKQATINRAVDRGRKLSDRTQAYAARFDWWAFPHKSASVCPSSRPCPRVSVPETASLTYEAMRRWAPPTLRTQPCRNLRQTTECSCDVKLLWRLEGVRLESDRPEFYSPSIFFQVEPYKWLKGRYSSGYPDRRLAL